MKNVKRFRLSVLQQFILSYLCIIIVVIAALIPLYSLTISAAQERQNDEKMTSIQSITNRISNELESASSLVTILSRSDEIRDIASYNVALTYSEQYKIAKQRRLLQLADTYWENFDDFYIFFSKNEAVMNPQRVWFSYSDFYGSWFSYEGVAIDTWTADMNKKLVHPRRGIEGLFSINTMNTFYLKPESKESIIYYIPFPDKPESGGAMFLLPISNLLESFGLTDSRQIQIYNSNGDPLFANSASSKPMPGVDAIVQDGSEYTRFTIHDKNNDLTYVLLYQVGALDGYVKKAYEQMLIYMIIAVAAGSVFSAILAYRQYRPVKRIHAAVGNSSHRHNQQYQNEYEYFIEAFLGMRDQDLLHSETIKRYNADMRRRALDDLLLKRYQDESELQSLSEYVNLPETYRVVLAHIDMLPGNLEHINSIDASMISIELISELEKITTGTIQSHPISERQVVFIVPASIERSQLDQTLDVLRSKLKAFRDTNDVDVFFTLSPVYTLPGDLWRAFDETKGATSFRYHSRENIIFCEDLKKHSHPPVLSEESISFFKGFVLQGDEKRAVEFIRTSFGEYYLGSGDFRQLYYSIRGVLVWLAAEASYDADFLIPHYSSYLSNDDQIANLIDICLKLCGSFTERRSKQSADLNKQILVYLAENYTNPDTYGISVAAHFDLNEKYLYGFFKEQNNIGLASYLENLRLEHACMLLTTTKKSIGEISSLVGFNTANTFYKAFVRSYGYSPSDYRTHNS